MRIAIVNDLALAREVLRKAVASVPGYSVAWFAEDGEVAVRKAVADRPDAILMDLVMPRMDGAEATRLVMRDTPCPVIVVTATVPGNFDLVFKAMGYGALDAVETPTLATGGAVVNAERLLARLRMLDTALHPVPDTTPSVTSRVTSTSVELPRLVVIGVSTGGPAALPVVVEAFPRDLPAAVLIAQHLDPAYIPGLAQRLAARCRLRVKVAEADEVPRPGIVYLAGTNDHLELSPRLRLNYTPHPTNGAYRPSVDVLFNSVAAHSLRPGVGVLLTGMGEDGARGMSKLLAAGWHTIAQDEATCVVYGMPKAAVERRAASEVLPLQQIGPSVVARLTSRRV